MTYLSHPVRRTSTSIIGFLILGIALLGGFFAGLQLIAVVVLHVSNLLPVGVSEWQFYIPAILSIAPPSALFIVGLFTLWRQNWALPYLGVAVLLSIVHMVAQWKFLLPIQLRNAMSDAERLGVYVGVYTVSFFTVLVYVAIFCFLRSKGTRAEFASANRRVEKQDNETIS